MDVERIVLLTILLTISLLGLVNGIEMQHFEQLDSCSGMVLQSSWVETSIQAVSLVDCSRRCWRGSCKSFHFGRSDGTCQLNFAIDSGDCLRMEINNDMTYYGKTGSLPCDNGGVLQADASCVCVDGYVGPTCDRLMTDCSEGFEAGNGYPHGVYHLHPPSSSTSFPVYCEMSNGGRTYIQRRYYPNDPPVDFNRSWTEYRDGFGSVTRDHWLGLEKIFHICKTGTCTLKIEARFRVDLYKQQYYNDFQLTSESDGYRLSFSTSRGKSGGRGIGDCLTPLLGKKFSTFDRDNDNFAGNCAEDFQSGFWFDACAECNPNGRMLRPLDEQRTNVPYEVFWTPDLGSTVPYQLRMWLVN